MSYDRRRGLRPVSPYAIVLALAIALTASFFLPARAEAAISDHTVTTISPSGTTINLFDYWVNPDDHLSVSGNGGINANHQFQFKDQGASEELNQYTGGPSPRIGIVNRVLTDGYPKLTDRWDGESLGYLFDSSTQTGKISHMGVTGLLRVKDGYYEYDSSQNYAAYNVNKNAFDVYDAAGVKRAGAEPHTVGQFFPFDAATEVFKEGDSGLVPNGITSQNVGDSQYNGSKPLNHYFGLSMSSRFVQPKGGKTNADKPMTFEFAGDDDVWVFIDDVLVGDIGGIHTSAKLTIDFQTGEIKVNDSPDGTLLSKFQEAKQDTTKGFKGSTFADGTNHTLKFFYLERGATDSNMKLKYNLVTVPESDIIKFDQDGKFVQGAKFQLYKTDKDFKNELEPLGSGTTDEAGYLTLTNDDDNGVINFDDLYNKDHSNKYYLLKETRVPEGYRSSLTATGGSMQLEYVPASAGNGAGGVIINRGGMDADSVVWKTGAFAGAKETITAPSTVYQANNDLTKVSLDSGILFAVVLKRDKSANADIKDQNNWYAVSGDPSTGMGYTLAGKPSKAGAIEAAKKDLHAFTLNTSGQYQVEIQNLPGDISKYYYLLSGDARKDAEYTVAIYYTAASSIAEADMDNTVHVFSDDLPDGKENFRRQFATRLLVSNIQNRLFVQKTDTAGKPVEGAKFGLYTADQVTTDANGKVVLKGEQTPYDTLTTGSVGNPVPLEGAGIFPNTSKEHKPLTKRTYYLKEISAPSGFLLNDTFTKVIVDDYGVHADAGTRDDGVSTFVGPGALMKSLGQFGAEGDIDNTLTWIKGVRQTSNGVTDTDGNLSWSNVDPAGAGDTVHLKYGANGRVYQYGPTEEGKPYRLETETGWIRMGITQDEQPKGTKSKGARADLRDMNNLNALFAGATCVRVANKREASLEVTKKVDVPDGLTGNKDAEFTFKFTVPKGKTYKAAVFEKAGAADEKQVGDMFDLTNGREQTITAGQTIRVYGLAEGDKYTVQELTRAGKMPAGFTLTKREQGGNALGGEGDSIEGTIAKQNANGTLADANKLVFTNTYSVKLPVTLTNAFWAQKVLRGRNWKDGDSFKIYLRADKGTPMPDGAGDAPVSDMKQVVKTVENGDKFDFGKIEYAKPGTYTYLIAEATPSQNDAGWLPGFGYSSASYRVTVTVSDNGDGTLSQPAVKMEQTYTDDGMSHEDNPIEVADKIAKITNTYHPKETSVTLKATKRFTGGALAGGDFTFQLLDSDGKELQAVQNDKDGKVAFAAIDYATPGEHDYAIREVAGNDSTIVYDAKDVKVHVKVTDEKGELKATVTYDGEKAVPTFTNSKPTTDVTVEATKTLKGKDLTAGAFTFGLYQGDATTVDPIQTVQNDKGGKIKLILTGLTIGEYDYTLKEVAGSDSTITYDSTAVKVHVSVKADGDKAKATVTYDDKNDAPTFTNKYQPAETLATLTAKKSYVKSDNTQATLKGGEFTFDLYEGDLTAEQLKGKQPIQTAKNGEDGTVTFPAINYTKAGEYKYTIAEQKGDLSHVTYDATVHHAVVTAVDNAGKLEASVTYDDGKTDAPTFRNTYNATGSAELTATKVVAVADGFKHDTKLKGGEYTFELKDADGNVLGTAKNDANGKVGFTRKFTLSDLGGAASKDFAYTIVEQPGTEPGMVYDTHPLIYKVTVKDDGTGTLNAKAVVTSTSGSDTFTNTYQPAATGLALGAQKSYVKKDDNTPIVPKDGEFTFDVYEGKMTAEQLAGAKPVRTATNGADGSVNFDAFSYAKPGTYEYTIVERKGDLAYVTYDDAVHHAVVTVVDNAGTLQASVAYDGADATKPTFTNTYKAKATSSGAIALTKSVDVHDGSYQLKAGDFAFELVGSDGTVLQTQKNDAKGKVYFNELTFDHAGTFPFTVREVQPTDGAPGVPGVTYTGKTYTLTYVVKDNNDGKLVVESSTVKPSEGTENGVTPNTMTFANSYQPGQTSYQISGTKVLENADPATTRTPADGEFTFALIDVATGQEIDRTTNVGKAFTFKAISYTATGSHAYQVKEVAGQDGTITYSDAVLDVTVNVTDDGSGQLTATANKTAADLTFTNTYTPTATTATITGTKALTGRDLAEGEFFFDLKDADGNVVQTVQNGADGTFGFAPLQLDKVGTYVYTVSERAGATANGVTYDTTVFTATVTVTENAETHALEAQVAYSKGGKAADAVAFSNSYAPAATEVKLGASKVLSGEDLKEGQFSFQLKDADGKVLQTAKNAADGTVGFEAISYDKPGTYAYSISEVDDGQKNVTYDAAEHRVTVTVTDDGAGHLVATVTYDGAVAPVFKNTYTPPTTPPTEPPTNPPSKSPVPKEEKPGLPYTGDTSLSPMALGGIAGGAVVLIAAGVILRRRNR
ncbi:MAG TPA: fibro-slime domain-containing protein [Coriobacteriaceae bacterium]|nr:fibro-slime domain-containing protein [Coriobacteriaceae bacterium]